MSQLNVGDATSDSRVDDQGDQPLRGELLSIEHLRVHAVELAKSLTIAKTSSHDRQFHSDLQRNADFLHSAYRTVARAIRDGEPLTPEAEWLLDNFYVVEEHLRQVRDDLPRGYFDELPKLGDRSPRIYRIALDLIIHTDSGRFSRTT